MFKCEFFLLCIFVSTLCSLEKCVCLDTLIYSKKNCRAYFSHLDLFFKLSYFRRDFERTIVDVVIAILIVFLIFLYFWPHVNLNILIMENHFHRPNSLNPFVFHPLQIIDLISKYFLFILFLSCITSQCFPFHFKSIIIRNKIDVKFSSFNLSGDVSPSPWCQENGFNK